MVLKGVVGVFIVLLALPSIAVSDSWTASVLYAIGRQLYADGDAAQAGRLFKMASTLDAGLCAAFHNEGVVAYEAHEPERAMQLFEQAIACDTSYAKAHYSLGVLQFEQHDLEAAGESFGRVVQYDPANQNAHFDYGVTLATIYREGTQDPALLEEAIAQFELAPAVEHSQENAIALMAIRESI